VREKQHVIVADLRLVAGKEGELGTHAAMGLAHPSRALPDQGLRRLKGG
jgi:hypothetical protein